MGAFFLLAVLYGALPLCGLSAFLALKKKSRPAIGATLALGNLLGTIHVFSFSGLWTDVFRQAARGARWKFLVVCSESDIAALYAAILITVSIACLILNICILNDQKNFKVHASSAT